MLIAGPTHYKYKSFATVSSSQPSCGHLSMGQARVIDTKKGEISSSPLHALVIGIDGYKSENIPPLTGAASDADAVDQYLREELLVPPSQIVNLRNEQATRAAIIHQIKALASREGIHRGDPVLIYFAGHGSTTLAPREWRLGNKIVSLIVPYDTDAKLETPEVLVYAIPDRTMGALLHWLAQQLGEEETGANITVIFDCCHSGSGTRELSQSSSNMRRARGFASKCILPPTLDEDIVGTVQKCRGVAVAAGFTQAGTKSHVLLAACREKESAFERHERGYFTHELLRVLRTVKPDHVTYRELMRLISDNIAGQTPQCEGYGVDRVLFNARVSGRKGAVYKVDRRGHGEFLVQAGSIHGVTDDTTFAIHTTRDFTLNDVPVATMKPVKVNAFTTRLGPPTHTGSSTLSGGSSYFAVQNSIGKSALRLHVASDGEDQACIWKAFKLVAESHLASGRSALVIERDPKHAHISAHAMKGHVTYTIHDPSIADHGLSQLCRTTKADVGAIQPVLSAAADFFWHLHHAPRPKKNALREKIEIQVFQLEPNEEVDLDELDDNLVYPWIADGPDLNDHGVVSVIADDDTPYGIRVWNDYKAPLHISAFYFNCSTLAIDEYYVPPVVGRNAEAPLPGRRPLADGETIEEGLTDEGKALKGDLTIGYGNGGGQPHTFFLRGDQDLDVGFIKLFISTQPVDLSYIAQPSPLDKPRDAAEAKPPIVAIWDAAAITVVQRRR